MIVGFTGHRDKVASNNDIASVSSSFPNSSWVHGGAVGFDSQVEEFAKLNGIRTYIIVPDYTTYGDRAPLVRNEEIVNRSDALVAMWDGRTFGGTWYTIQLAVKKGIKIILIPAHKRVIQVGLY